VLDRPESAPAPQEIDAFVSPWSEYLGISAAVAAGAAGAAVRRRDALLTDVVELADSLCEVDPPADSEPDPEPDSGPDVDSLADSEAADSLVLCEVDSVVDWLAESLVPPVLPGVRTALPSVARVFRLAAVTS